MHIIQLTGRVYLITNSGVVQKSYMINWFFIYASAVEATSMLGLIWIRLDSLEADMKHCVIWKYTKNQYLLLLTNNHIQFAMS